jgi:hypothetical protein
MNCCGRKWCSPVRYRRLLSRSQQYEKLIDFGFQPVWLSDSRRLLFQDKIFLLDSQSKKVHEVLSVTPHNIGYAVTLSRDDRQIYFSLVTTEQTSG